MSLQTFNPNYDIGKSAKLNYKTIEQSTDDASTIANLMPVIQKNMTKLYKLTGKYYNQILYQFMCGFLGIDKEQDNDFCRLLTESRHLMIPKYDNLSYYIAKYITVSTAQEVSYLSDGLAYLCNYFEWRNQHSKNHLASYKTHDNLNEDLQFIKKCGESLFFNFPSNGHVYLPDKYVFLEDIQKRQKDLQNILNDKAIDKFIKDLKMISDTCDKYSNIDNLQIVPSPNQESLDRYL